jgi:site-specific DNA recombinase
MTKRAAVYIRMSTDDQPGSPERQRDLVLPYCERKCYKVVEIYEDLAMRGWDDSRPGFQRLLQDAQAGRFDVIVVDEQSRLCRSDPIVFAATVAYPLRGAGVALETVDRGTTLTWDGNDLVGLLLGMIDQHKASQESVTLGRRVASGMAKRAKNGEIFTGRAPYGLKYRLEEGRRVGYELGDPDHVRIVQFIFDAYVNRDMSLMGIVAELNAGQIPTPAGCREWGKTTVHNILANHVYAGCYVWGKVAQGRYYRSDGGEISPTARGANKSERRPPESWIILPGNHTPIVDRALFDEAQERRAANRSRTSPSRKRGIYSLSQLLYCSHCGSRMHGTKVKGKPVYRCGSNMSKAGCAPRTTAEALLLNAVVEALRETFLLPENRERLRAELLRQQQQGVDAAATKASELRTRVANLDAKIAKARKNLILLDAEDIPDAKEQIREWERARSAAQAELDAAAPTPAESLDHLLDSVEQFIECVQAADPNAVRAAARESLDRVELRFDEVPKAKVTRYPLAGGTIHLRGDAVCAASSTSETALICTSKSRPCRSRSCPPRPTAPPAPTCASRSTRPGACSGSASVQTDTASTRR